MGWPGKPRQRREGRRLSEREVSESNLVRFRDVATSFDMTNGGKGGSRVPMTHVLRIRANLLNPEQLIAASQRCSEKKDRPNETVHRRTFRVLVVERFR